MRKKGTWTVLTDDDPEHESCDIWWDLEGGAGLHTDREIVYEIFTGLREAVKEYKGKVRLRVTEVEFKKK